jgi:hypothetical protein
MRSVASNPATPSKITTLRVAASPCHTNVTSESSVSPEIASINGAPLVAISFQNSWTESRSLDSICLRSAAIRGLASGPTGAYVGSCGKAAGAKSSRNSSSGAAGVRSFRIRARTFNRTISQRQRIVQFLAIDTRAASGTIVRTQKNWRTQNSSVRLRNCLGAKLRG